ncbi:hypothetical protein BGZ83_011785 [Gryganskiella cystojenkinii]|nr:hypothetical protein BGZ83_011785 [Gryganskiella cystojenkinii]
MALTNVDAHEVAPQLGNYLIHPFDFETPQTLTQKKVAQKKVRNHALVDPQSQSQSHQDHKHQYQHEPQHQPQSYPPQIGSLEACPDPADIDPYGLGIELSKRLAASLPSLPDDTNTDNEIDGLHHQAVTMALSSHGHRPELDDRRDTRRQSTGNLNTHHRIQQHQYHHQHSTTATIASVGLQQSHSLNHLPSASSSFSSEQSKRERLRDYAKVFPLVRRNTGSAHEHLNGRNSPFMRSREVIASNSNSLVASPAIVSSTFSPTVSTPTTPLSRGGIGYMGNQTLKALNTIPRSASMGYIAAVNNMNANNCNAAASSSVSGSTVTSNQGSPVINNNSNNGFNDGAVTPTSVRSYRSTSSFFTPPASQQVRYQSPAEVKAAEQSLDDHLKAIRRRSFAAEVMSSPGGVSSPTCIDITSEPGQEQNAGYDNSDFGGPGSPRTVSGSSSRASNFRMSFSSPNLGKLQRRSSLALKSVLNSIVNSPVVSDDSSVLSSSSSYTSSPPRSATSSAEPNMQSVDQLPPFQEPPLPAQDLLRAEYGEIYSDVMQQRLSSAAATGEQQQPGGLTMIQDLDARLQPYATPSAAVVGGYQTGDVRGNGARSPAQMQNATPSITPRRSRSGSVSSAWTATTTSSGSSDSTTSTNSNLTSLSNEEKRISTGSGYNNAASKPPGPPPTFLNRILINQYHNHSSSNSPRPRLSLLRRGSSSGRIHTTDLGGVGGDSGSGKRSTRSGNTTPISKKFPSQGDLSSYSWDYRRELPVD